MAQSLLPADDPFIRHALQFRGILVQLIKQKLPKFVDATPYDIQVLTPMRKGLLGVERLNGILQRYMNPPANDKVEKEYGSTVFREGDKVMQTKNNYQLAWEIRTKFGLTVDKGLGIFNGDMGIIRQINDFAEQMIIEFDEGRMVEYPYKLLDELELAYAITIHKSQGSEYPAVVIPLLSGPRMLMNRNLLYTAVTRAKKCVTIVGDDTTFEQMIENNSQQRRYSGLKDRLLENKEVKMNFTGIISKINHIIVSDPSYDKNVWCRYENDHFNANNWTADIQLQDVDETIEGYCITGTDIGIMLHHPSVNARMEQDRIRFPSIYKLNKYTIGMDRACVSIGVNEKASEIANEKDSSEYETALHTLTDGQFGTVYEGVDKDGNIGFIHISGYIDNDAGYTNSDIVNYITNNLQVTGLTLVGTEEDECIHDEQGMGGI